MRIEIVVENMPKKCCVGDCTSKYDTEEEYTNVHSFPTDPEERQRWLNVLPNIVPKINKNTVVCVNHWPCDYETFEKKVICALSIPRLYFRCPHHSNAKPLAHPTTSSLVKSMLSPEGYLKS